MCDMGYEHDMKNIRVHLPACELCRGHSMSIFGFVTGAKALLVVSFLHFVCALALLLHFWSVRDNLPDTALSLSLSVLLLLFR